jgi:alkanesulfonate monooxygenase
MRPLEFGWYLPTHGDTTAYGVAEAHVAGSPELCDRVVQAAEQAGFEYLLIPVGSVCWEARITGAFMAARSPKIKLLIAARPGYINPVLLAKMISTFDQMSGGRICINLIAGQNESEVEGEGVRYAKEARYALMEEEVSILKALWTARGPVHFAGKFHTLSGAHIRPRRCSGRSRNSISAAARGRPGRCRRSIPMCTCSGAICRSGSWRISPKSGSWRRPMAANRPLASACGCR